MSTEETLGKVTKDAGRGAYFLFVGDVFSKLALAAASILIARLLGPEDFGVYALTLFIPLMLVQLGTLGLDKAMVRYPAKLKAAGVTVGAARMIKSGILLSVTIGVALFLVSFTLSGVFAVLLLRRPVLEFLLKVASVLIIFDLTVVTLGASFIGLDRSESTALVRFVQAVVKATLSPLLILFGLGVLGVIAGHVVSYVAATAIGVILLARHNKFLSGLTGSYAHFWSDSKELLRFGLPVHSSIVLPTLSAAFGNIVLAYFASNAEIGNYNAAMGLSAIVVLLANPIQFSILPAFSKLDISSQDLKRFFRIATKYTCLLIVPAGLFVMTFANEVIELIYGQSFSVAGPFLSLYSTIFLYGWLTDYVLSSFYIGIGKTIVILKMNVLQASVFVPSTLALAWLYGVPGLITALLLSKLVMTAYGLLVAKRSFHVDLDSRNLLTIYLSSLIPIFPLMMFLQLSSLPSLFSLLIGSVTYSIAYLTLMGLMHAFRPSELEELLGVFQKITVVRYLLSPVVSYEKRIMGMTHEWRRQQDAEPTV